MSLEAAEDGAFRARLVPGSRVSFAHALDAGDFLIGVEVRAESPVTVSIFRGVSGLFYAWNGVVSREVELHHGGVLARHSGAIVRQVYGPTREAGTYRVVIEAEAPVDCLVWSTYWEIEP